MFWLVILQKHVFDNNKDALKWWRGKGGDLDSINSILTNIKSALLLETYK